MSKLMILPNDYAAARDTHYVWDDFYGLDTTQWTATAGGTGGSIAASTSAAGGKAVMTTGTAAQDSCCLSTPGKSFLPAANKAMVFETNLQYSEANTNKAAILLGFFSVANTSLVILADTTGVVASGTGAFIYKLPGTTVWICAAQVGSTLVQTVSNNTAGGTTAQILRIEVKPFSSTQADVMYFLNDIAMTDANGKPIKITWTYTSAVNCYAMIFAKGINGTTSEVLNVDNLFAAQKR